ncbi:MAG TPA: adenylate/guanylate cyclase domain-containing protein [Bradyrhizobium sp.]|nr:adenylate/guanylate cyclase domain-containing protein [Bradyrhizobium sp.]
MDTTRIEQLNDWLIDGARSATGPNGPFSETCERLLAAGIPLARVALFIRVLHPDIYGRAFFWRPGAEVVVSTANVDIETTPGFLKSPVVAVYQSRSELRCRLDDPASRRFPFLDEMRAEGVTDYVALPLHFTDGAVQVVSYTTKHQDGFADEQLAALRHIAAPMARLAEVITLRRTAAGLLDTYVGNSAGERILAGDIRRGHAEAMQAVIWLSDLRGFTALSDRLSPRVVVEILNRYFDCQVPPIRKHGGEILKFMGDGLLAVFPIANDGGDVAEVGARVLEVAREARANVVAMRHGSDEAAERFRFGVALHIGDILFGNIGGSGRLDFTCIGPAVNLAARLEKIAGRLGRTVVASSDFAGLRAGDWSDLGEFPIAGLSSPQRVYGLRDEAMTANSS